jgi:hypothetical protein
MASRAFSKSNVNPPSPQAVEGVNIPINPYSNEGTKNSELPPTSWLIKPATYNKLLQEMRKKRRAHLQLF